MVGGEVMCPHAPAREELQRGENLRVCPLAAGFWGRADLEAALLAVAAV